MRRTTHTGGRSRDAEERWFICRSCGAPVHTAACGTRQRNHCPYCLHSLHVDVTPGDRRELCGGIMEPIGIWVRERGEAALLHRCRTCGALRSNRVAGDDDDTILRHLAMRALKAVSS